MTVVNTRVIVSPDGAVSVTDKLPAGEHAATVIFDGVVGRPLSRPFTIEDFPIHDAPWDDSVSLRREDFYDEQGCLR